MALTAYPVDSAAPPPAGPFVALVPGALAVCHPLDLPARVRGAARIAIARRHLADRLALAPDAVVCHPVGPAQGAWRAMVVADAGLVADWRARLAPHGARCRALLPDYLVLPWQDGAWVLYRRDAPGGGSEMLARLGADMGFALPWDLGLAALGLSGPVPRRVILYGASDVSARSLADLDATPERHDRAPPLTDPGKAGFALDLREDRAAALRRMQAALRPWRAVAALALIGAVGLTVHGVVQRDRARLALGQTQAAVTALVRDRFIPTGPILDARAQVARLVAGSMTGDDTPGPGPGPGPGVEPIQTIRRAALALTGGPAEVESIVLAPGDGGGVRLALTADSLATLEQAIAALRAAGLSVEVPQSASGAGGRARAVVRVASG